MARPVYMLTMLTVMLLLATPVAARILYVTPNGDDANSGLSWAEAKRTVRAAIDTASSGDEIWLAAGTYYENIVMKGGLKLYGGFMGTEASLDERPPFPRPQPDPYETVLDGMQAGRVITVPDSATESVTINGLTIRNGQAADSGGGVYGGRVNLADCIVTSCSAGIWGGGVALLAESSVERCTITNNEALNGGGAYVGTCTFTDCLIARNRADVGGGLTTPFGTVEVLRCVFQENQSTHDGGGILTMDYAVVQLVECDFIGNVAGTDGGALRPNSHQTEVIRCRFIRNQADSGGAIYYTAVGMGLTVRESIFVGNEAWRWGGAVRISGNVTVPVFEQCLIMNNSANYGGGVLCDNYTMGDFIECNIANNTARYDGAGIALYHKCETRFIRCAITNNFAWRSGGGVLYTNRTIAPLQHCTIARNRALANGAGVYLADSSSPSLRECVIRENHAVRDGGGLFAQANSSPKLQGCLILGNISENNGGGIYLLDNPAAQLTRCAVSFNTARNSGGGMYAYNSSPVVLYSMISGNSAGYYGGGIYCEWQASAQVLNTMVLDNTAQRYGGGMYIYRESTPTITNCTFAFNTAPNQGGGIYTYGSSPSVNNTIVAFNTSGIYRSGGTLTLRYNCVYGNTAYNYKGIADPTGTNGNISVDPLFTGRNGHLLPGSPCINAGDNGATGSDWWDIDGESRIVGDRVDIGADEFVPPTVNGRVLFGDYGGWLPPVLDMEVRLGAASEFRNIWLGTDGSFTLPSAPTGAFSLSVKPSHWLRRTVEVDTSAGSVSGVEIALTNGDIDGDNEITLFDFGQLVQAFGTLPGDENWNANADLDGDNEVTLFDFGILIRYFGELGDE